MAYLLDKASPPTVMIIGPPANAVGGIATVVGQMLSLDLDHRYRIEFFPQTESCGTDEPLEKRIARHVRHLSVLWMKLRRTNAAIVHLHTCSGFSFFRSVLDMLVAKRLGCRTVLHIHGAAFDDFCARSGFLGRRTISWARARADQTPAPRPSSARRWLADVTALRPGS